MTEKEDDFDFKDFYSPFTQSKAIVFLIIIGFVVYFNSLFGQFVWDDIPQLVNNPLYQSISNIREIFLDHTYTYYRPIGAIYMSIIYTIFGPTSFWFHLPQVALHIVNSILVFLLFKKFLSIKVSFFLALVFLVHPINVEAVSYIASVQIILSFFFALTASFIALSHKLVRPLRYVLLFTFFLLSCLSKETGVIFIILIPFLMLASGQNFKKREYLQTAGMLGSSLLIYVAMRLYISSTPIDLDFSMSPVPIMQASLLERLITLPMIIFFYLKTLFYPIDLAISQNWIVNSTDVTNLFLPLIIDIGFLALLIFGGLFLYKRKKKALLLYLFFAIWMFLSWVIHWNLIPLDMTVAERWFYFVLVGLLGMVGIFISEIDIKRKELKQISVWFLAIIIILLSLRTMIRNNDWNTPLNLYEHDSKISTESYDLENSYASNLIRAGRNDEALPHLEKSIKLAPEYWVNWGNLGVYYINRGEVDKSIEAFNVALENNENYSFAIYNLSKIYFENKTPEEARKFLDRAVEKLPEEPNILYLSGITHYRLGDKAKAINEVKKAYQITEDPTLLNLYLQMEKGEVTNN